MKLPQAIDESSRQLLQSLTVAFVVARGTELRSELVNKQFTKLTGYTIGDIPDVAHWWPLAYPDQGYREMLQLEWRERTGRAVQLGTAIEPMEARVLCKDSSYRDIEFHFSSLGDLNLICFIDITERKKAQEDLTRLLEAENERLSAELEDAATEIKTLSGLLPICAGCKKIRDDRDQWHPVETYIRERTSAQFSHGVCPECASRLYPEFYKKK